MYLAILLESGKKNIIYDAVKNAYIEIPNNIYQKCKLDSSGRLLSESEIDLLTMLFGRNIFQKYSFEITPPFSKNTLATLALHNCSQLVLSITERCNMRCEYCGYHSRYEKRYCEKEMPLDVAFQSIYYYLQNTIGLQEIVITFYGGEPLLRFDFIQKCIDFALKNSRGQNIRFLIATNVTLLNEEIIDFLYKNNVLVSVSLDGPRNLHDRYRFFKGGLPTYDCVIENLKKIYYKYPEYFLSHFVILPVYAPPYNDAVLCDYFENFPLDFLLGELYVTPYFKTVLSAKGKYDNIIFNREQKNKFEKFNKINQDSLYKYKNLITSPTLLTKTFPGGNCIPGCRKLYVNAKGEFYVCEKVPENKEGCIGNIKQGIDKELLYNQYVNATNKYKTLNCKSCWAVHFCSSCFRNINSITSSQCDKIKTRVKKDMELALQEVEI